MVPTSDLSGAFEGNNIERFLDHTDRVRPTGIRTNLTWVVLGDVETNRAESNPIPHILDRCCQGQCIVS